MPQFNFEKTDIDGVLIITPTVHGDDRGYFMKPTRRTYSFLREFTR